MNYQDPAYFGEIEKLKGFARQIYSPPVWLDRAAWAGVAIGILGFLLGLQFSPNRTWGAMDASFLFWIGLSQGGIVVAAVFHTSWARWGRYLQRMVELLGGFLVLSPVLYAVLWLGRGHLFFWLGEADRSPWLSSVGMLIREESMLLVMSGLSAWWLYRSMRPDLELVSGGKTNDTLSSLLLRNWQGETKEVERTRIVLDYLGPAIIMGFCWGYGMLSVDMALGLDSEVKSTMFPGIYWVTAFLAPLALTCVLVFAWRRWDPRLEEMITPSVIQDLGNLTWGFVIFRTWFDWSQYIIMWYGDLPDEARYLIDRWRTHPFNYLAWASLNLEFIFPFLLGFIRRLKRNPTALACYGVMVLLGIMARVFADVMPDVPHLAPPDFGLIELAITLGFAGGLALPYLWLVRRAPLFPVSDPLFSKAVETRGAPET